LKGFDLDIEMRANRHKFSPYHLLLQFLQHNPVYFASRGLFWSVKYGEIN